MRLVAHVVVGVERVDVGLEARVAQQPPQSQRVHPDRVAGPRTSRGTGGPRSRPRRSLRQGSASSSTSWRAGLELAHARFEPLDALGRGCTDRGGRPAQRPHLLGEVVRRRRTPPCARPPSPRSRRGCASRPAPTPARWSAPRAARSRRGCRPARRSGARNRSALAAHRGRGSSAGKSCTLRGVGAHALRRSRRARRRAGAGPERDRSPPRSDARAERRRSHALRRGNHGGH